MHMLLHRQVHGDGSLTDSHKRQQQCEAGGFLNQGVLAAKRKVCRKTHSQGSPSDRRGTLPSDTPHQKAYYELQVEDLLSEVQSEPILSGILVHRQYLHDRDHEPVNTSNYNSLVRAE